jgi:hypothetical protein
MSDTRKTPTIPEVTHIDEGVARILRPIRMWINSFTGRSGTPVARLEGVATLADVQNKVNEIIDRMNG